MLNSGEAFGGGLKKLLIISVSDLRSDPRVSRQIELFKDDYDVITMGYGDRPDGVRRHVRLPRPRPTNLAQKLRKMALSLFGRHEATHLEFPGIAAAKDWFATHKEDFDAVFVNDLSPLPLAVGTGKPVHVDLHEYSLGQHPTFLWRLYQLPVLRWAAQSLKDVTSATVVSPGIGKLYEDLGAPKPHVVTNGPKHLPGVEVSKTNWPIKLVHMGVAHEQRSLEMCVRAVQAANERKPGSLTLDMYLVPIKPAYLETLEVEARRAGPSVRLHDPVPFDEMLPTLKKHDAALIFYPPKLPNLKYSLPNKFFEAVQARIGVIVGPSQEMIPYVEAFGFGEATDGWSVEDLTETLAGLTTEKVDGWKEAADSAAEELGAENQDLIWRERVAALFGGDADA